MRSMAPASEATSTYVWRSGSVALREGSIMVEGF